MKGARLVRREALLTLSSTSWSPMRWVGALELWQIKTGAAGAGEREPHNAAPARPV